jgi:hypothetical protein
MGKDCVIQLLLALFLLFAPHAHAVEQDKTKHFVASAGISSLSLHLTQNRWLSLGICGAVGLTKELTDDYIDKRDLVADALGCISGVAVYESVNYLINVKPQQDGAGIGLRVNF